MFHKKIDFKFILILFSVLFNTWAAIVRLESGLATHSRWDFDSKAVTELIESGRGFTVTKICNLLLQSTLLSNSLLEQNRPIYNLTFISELESNIHIILGSHKTSFRLIHLPNKKFPPSNNSSTDEPLLCA